MQNLDKSVWRLHNRVAAGSPPVGRLPQPENGFVSFDSFVTIIRNLEILKLEILKYKQLNSSTINN